jgi:hypothetical protein
MTSRESGLLFHPRFTQVARARCDLDFAICNAQETHELTPAELVSILASLTSEYAKYVLRKERYPLNPDKKSDEA